MKIISKETSKEDNVVKYAVKLDDSNIIEVVSFPQYNHTICLSCQIGCPVRCVFCESGKDGMVRNLNKKEIIEQFKIINKEVKKNSGNDVSTLIFMGIGEPLLNYNEVVGAIREIKEENNNLDIRITTVGITNKIYQLAEERIPLKLCLSLHATNDEQRKKIIPIAKNYQFDDLIKSIYFFEKNGINTSEIAIHYLIFDNFNDSIDDANELVRLFKDKNFEIIIKSVCPVENQKFFESKEENILKFINVLEKNNMKYHYSPSRGRDMKAGCGQLRRKLI
jgi:23S rRNA (adenine2503-C2)-methyltransferase